MQNFFILHKQLQRIMKFALLVITLNYLGHIALVKAEPIRIHFSAEYLQGTCEISVSQPIIEFNNGASILTSNVKNGTAVQEKFTLDFINCDSKSLTHYTPKIKVSGESLTLGGSPLYVNSASSTAKGYGFLLTTEGNSYFKANNNLAETGWVNATWTANSPLSILNKTKIPFTTTISCGNCSGELQGGKLHSTVTFQFFYD
ncbi:type 1 fimbrial protein [Providencia vermicola]|uniref:fimbrial protein n=1 Tax=Providencia vermicola TaxID=333965 RepID=UPI0013A7B291|nr:fimbrial protein [Providencia vermicola]QIC15173.1 type 1 fimbrial protein [Providencia vermicola]